VAEWSMTWVGHPFIGPAISLHVASIKAFQILEDNNSIQVLIVKDHNGKTSLHVLFTVIEELQENDFKCQITNRTLRDNINLEKGGSVAFSPPKELMELLLKSPEADGQDQGGYDFDPGCDDKIESVAYIEDEAGFLPLELGQLQKSFNF
jgi:hypothetical protein